MTMGCLLRWQCLTLLVLMALSSLHAACPDNEWTQDGELCYKLFSGKKKYNDAQALCESNSATLAFPSSVQENNALKDVLKASGEKVAWIGIQQILLANSYGDLHDDYINWKRTPKAACAVMTKSGGWIGKTCASAKYKFICQTDVTAATTPSVPEPETTEEEPEPTEDPESDCEEGGKYDFPVTGTHTACLEDSPSLVSEFEMTDAVREDIVNVHNAFRASVSPKSLKMLKMSYDSELEMIAQKWANSCPSYHDEGTHRFSPGRFRVGQNLYAQSGGAMSASIFDSAMTGWWAEVSDYTFGTPYYDQLSGPAVGHYTQMAWANSYLIGCAAADCGSELWVVCNYGPAGNMGNFLGPYKEADPESNQCTVCQNCENGGLCACDGLVCNSGMLNADTCTCTCGELSYQTEPNCELRCDGTDKWWCGSLLSDCTSTQSLKECPHMCGICP